MDTTSETCTTEATAPTEPPPATGTQESPATPELVRLVIEAGRIKAAESAIRDWTEKAHVAADLAVEADIAEATAFLGAEGAEGMRKAQAKARSAKERRVAEHAEIEARAAARLVDLLVGAGGRT